MHTVHKTARYRNFDSLCTIFKQFDVGCHLSVCLSSSVYAPTSDRLGKYYLGWTDGKYLNAALFSVFSLECVKYFKVTIPSCIDIGTNFCVAFVRLCERETFVSFAMLNRSIEKMIVTAGPISIEYQTGKSTK